MNSCPCDDVLSRLCDRLLVSAAYESEHVVPLLRFGVTAVLIRAAANFSTLRRGVGGGAGRGGKSKRRSVTKAAVRVAVPAIQMRGFEIIDIEAHRTAAWVERTHCKGTSVVQQKVAELRGALRGMQLAVHCEVFIRVDFIMRSKCIVEGIKRRGWAHRPYSVAL